MDSAALLLCWVPKTGDEGFVSALETFPGQVLVLVGEQGVGGACGGSTFWSRVDCLYEETSSICVPRFMGWYDSVSVYTRREGGVGGEGVQEEVVQEEAIQEEAMVTSLPPRSLGEPII